MGQINLEEYEDRVRDIWKEFDNLSFLNESRCEYRRYPILPQSVKKNAILFVGINPSFPKGTQIEEENKKIEFYSQSKNDEKDIQYFEKFKEIARYCGEECNWTHLDLLFIRETKQKFIDKLTYSTEGRNFINEQLTITFEVIKNVAPKIIVVTNALASEFFGKKKKEKHQGFDKIWQGFALDFEKDFDNEIGTYKISMNGREVPIIFSGMLSGQRALDIASLERLKWQIKMILEKN